MLSHPEHLHRDINFKTNSPCAAGLNENPIKTVTVRDFDTLASYVPAWDHLAQKAPQKIATLLPGWVDAFLRHRLKPNERWFCSFAYAATELVGVLPVVITPHPILGIRWPLLRTPSDGYYTTLSGDIVLSAEQPDTALHGLLAEVNREVPGHLRLDLQACGGPLLSCLP
jgi:hypothetical protein